MTEQSNTIDWDVLIRNLTYLPLIQAPEARASDLYLQPLPGQTEDFDKFIESFCRTLVEHTTAERQKYQKEYLPPNENEYLIDDETALLISPTIKRLEYGDGRRGRVQTCTHHDDEDMRFSSDGYYYDDKDFTDGFTFNCECVLPLRERKVHAFLRRHRSNDCYQFEAFNGAGAFNLHVIMALLIHGKLDPILRVCSRPDVDYTSWKSIGNCNCMGPTEGWDQLFKLSLHSYLVLNILRKFPELRVQEHRPSVPTPADTTYRETYRDTNMYQKMLHACTSDEIYMPTYPHRDFFGVVDGQFGYDFQMNRGREWPCLVKAAGAEDMTTADWERMPPLIGQDDFPYGQVPFEIFLNCDQIAPDLPHAREVEAGYWSLRRTVLPEELVIQIMNEITNSGPRRRLPVPHDPFHEDNSVELDRYLQECWGLMLRCSVFANTLGQPIDWRHEVAFCLRRICAGPGNERIDTKLFVPRESREGLRV